MIDLTYYYQQVLKNPTATPEAKAEAREKLGLSSTLEGTMGPHKIPEKAPLSRVGQLGKTISEYEKKYHPSEMTNFRELMQSSSRFAYDKRRGEQKMGFEPSQVSGQTFADIIGWAEQQRGAAVSDIYKTGVYGEVEEQKTIGDILEDLRKERDTLIDNRQQFIQKLASSSPRTLIALGGENIDSILSGADITPEVYQMIAEEAKEEEGKTDKDFWSAIDRGKNELQQGESWGNVFNRIKAEFRDAPDSMIDAGLGTSWREEGAYTKFKGQAGPEVTALKDLPADQQITITQIQDLIDRSTPGIGMKEGETAFTYDEAIKEFPEFAVYLKPPKL